MPAIQVATKAFADIEAAPTVTMKGSVIQSKTTITLDLGIKHGQGCVGTIGEGSQGSFKLILIGKTVYINPDKQFWTTNGGANAAAAIALVNGRYIKTTTSSNGLGSLGTLCDLSQLFGSLNTSTASTKAVKKPVTTLNGVRVLPLEDTTDKSLLYVTDVSKPEVVALTSPGNGTLTFTVGTPVNLTAPPASQVIDGSAIGM